MLIFDSDIQISWNVSITCYLYLVIISSFVCFISLLFLSIAFIMSYAKSTHLENTSLQWYYLPDVYSTSLSFMAATFLAILRQQCNNLDILSSMMGILLYDLVSYGKVLTSVSVCLITKTSVWNDRSYTTETLSIFYSSFLYIILVVPL